MSALAEPAVSVKPDGSVTIDSLTVDGPAAEVAAAAIANGQNPEAAVRQVLDVGARVLQHGAGVGAVDAVSAEVTRLLDGLAQRAEMASVASDGQVRLAQRAEMASVASDGQVRAVSTEITRLLEDVVAAAMIDRLVHHAEILAFKGDSRRLKGRDLARPATPTD